MLPNKFLQKAATLKFAKSTMCVHTCIACQVCSNILASMQSGYRRALLAKYVLTYWQVCKVGTAVPCLATPLVNLQAKLIFAKIAECTYTCCACYSTFPHDSKCHFLKWKSAATAALSAQKRNGRTLSMAAKPFILTIDSVRRFCYTTLF